MADAVAATGFAGGGADAADWQARADVPLTPADCFLRAFDHDTRRRNGASHLSQLVLRLGPGFDLDGFRRLVDAIARANPIVRAPIVRPYGVAAPVYRTTRPSAALPRVVVHPDAGSAAVAHATGARPIPPAFFDRLNQPYRIRAGDLLRFDVVPYDAGRAGTDLAITWAHMLLDGAGSERFVAWLERCHRGERQVDDLGPEEGAGLVAPGMLRAQGLGRARGRLATAWQAHMKELAQTPPRSLANGPTRDRQALRYTLRSLAPDETACVVARASEKAGFLTPVLFHLAAAIRAHAEVFRQRGIDPRSFAVPVVANLRPKGASGATPIFRTHVSMLWFQVRPDETRTLDGLVEALKAQRHARIKQGFLEQGSAAMDFARYAPAPFYARMARRTLRGELASFFFAYTGEFLTDTRTFCGAEILNGFHAPGVPASPGSATILSIHRGRLNAAHVFQDGSFSEREQGVYEERLVADLVGREP